MAFDLSKYELSDSGELTILRGGDDMLVDGKPVVVHLHGTGSKEYVSAKFKLENAGAQQMTALLQNKNVKDNAEVSAKQKAEFLAACTKKIDNFPVDPLDIYSNHKLQFITDQVEKYLSDEENFM